MGLKSPTLLFQKRLVSSAVVFILIGSIFLIYLAPPVRANPPIDFVNQAVNHCPATGTCSTGALGGRAIQKGNLIVVGINVEQNAGNTCPSSFTVADTFGNTYTTIVGVESNCGTGFAGTPTGNGLYASLSAFNGTTDNISVTMNGGSGTLFVVLMVTVMSGNLVIPSTGETFFSATGNTVALAPPLTVPAGGIAFAVNELGSPTLAVGTSISDCNPSTITYYTITHQLCESTTAGPVSFTSTQTGNNGGVIAAAVFPSAVSTVTVTTGKVQVGSCPSKNTGTFTLSNSTGYYYSGLANSHTTVNDVDSFVASVSGPTNRIVAFGVYVGQTAGTISNSNPFVLTHLDAVLVTHGVNNQPISAAESVSVPAGYYYAVLIVSTDKVTINQSSLAGLGQVAATLNSVPATIGTAVSNANKLYLCMNATFLSVTVVTTTVVSTQAATTTVTSTNTVTTINVSSGAASVPFLLLDVIVIIGPAILIAELTKQLWGGILGAVLGTVVAALAGIAPFWLIIVLALTLVAALFFGRNSGGGGV